VPCVGTSKAPGGRFAGWMAVVGMMLITAAPVAFWFTLYGTTMSWRLVGVVAWGRGGLDHVLTAAERAGRMDRGWWPALVCSASRQCRAWSA
jgi:hypothetical protein